MKSKRIINNTHLVVPTALSRAREENTGRERNPELIEKFYKQIVNSFGYAYPAKV